MACAFGGSSRRPAQHRGHRDSVNFNVWCEASEEENEMPTVKVTGIVSIAFAAVCFSVESCSVQRLFVLSGRGMRHGIRFKL